jgi:hypothetical protein
MTKLMESMGERLLRRLLNQTDAGACVAEQGDYCYCQTDLQGGSFCDVSKHRRVYYKKRWTFDCYGVCKKTSSTCGTWVSTNEPC